MSDYLIALSNFFYGKKKALIRHAELLTVFCTLIIIYMIHFFWVNHNCFNATLDMLSVRKATYNLHTQSTEQQHRILKNIHAHKNIETVTLYAADKNTPLIHYGHEASQLLLSPHTASKTQEDLILYWRLPSHSWIRLKINQNTPVSLLTISWKSFVFIFISMLLISLYYVKMKQKKQFRLFQTNSINTVLHMLINSMPQPQATLSEEVRSAACAKETITRLEMEKKKALDLNADQLKFIANLSHEVRTHLNSIIGFSQLMKKTELSEQQMSHLCVIDNASSALLDVLNGVLDFSRMQSSQFFLNQGVFHLRALIDEVICMLALESHRKNIELSSFVGHEVNSHFIGDSVRIKQALLNIVSNAIKFTHTGHVHVHIERKQSDKQKNLVQFSISDTGIGLSEQDQKNIFQEFHRANASESFGTGLGLVITKQLIECMQGSLSIKSSIDVGSTFEFIIPLKNYPQKTKPAVSFYGKRIAIYEPLELTRQNILNLLENWHIKPVIFNDLDQLKFSTSSFDALIFGCTVSININTLIQLSQFIAPTPMLVLINQCNLHTQKQQTSEHPIYWLQKPFHSNQLEHMLYKLLPAKKNIAKQYKKKSDQCHLMVVDDSSESIQLMKTLLGDCSIKLSYAQSGLEALRQIEHHHFDLILMDIQMPEINGIQTIKTMNTNPKITASSVPIIALTAHVLPQEQRSIFDAGFIDCLQKPISESTLINCIEKHTQQSIKKSHHNTLGEILKFDSTVALQRCGDRFDLAFELLSELLDEAPSFHKNIQQHCQHGKMDNAYEEIHRLLGALRYTGLIQLEQLVEQTMTAIKQSNPCSLTSYKNIIHALEQLTSYNKSTILKCLSV